MNAIIDKFFNAYGSFSTFLDSLRPFSLFGARLYIGWVFFLAGLTKITDWDTTLWLFAEEYSVPFLNHELAAFLGTGGELIFPILLVMGIATRFNALGLSVVNIVAVLSLEEITPAALNLHILWGGMLGLIIIFGAGFISLDHMIKRKNGIIQKELITNI